MIFYVGVLVTQLEALLGLYLIDRGAYMSEQRRFGFENGSFYLYLLFAVAAVLVFFLACTVIKLRTRTGDNRWLFGVASGTFLLICLYASVKNPTAGRFDIFANLGALTRFFNFFQIAYEGLYIYSMFKERRLSARLMYLFVAMFIYFVKHDQFSSFFECVLVFLMSCVIFKENSFGTVRMSRVLKAAVSLVIVGVLCGALVYKFSNMADALTFVLRLVNGGQLFWGTINLVHQHTSPPNMQAYFDNFFSFQMYHGSSEYGLGQLMCAVTGPICISFLDSGVRMSGGYPSMLIFQWGLVPAFFLNIVCTIAFVLLLKLQMFIVRELNFLVFLLFFVKVYAMYSDFYIMGEYGTWGFKNLVYVALVLSAIFLYRPRERNQPEMLTSGS